ncbi:LacI family DNA-binding transcriptional regulator [Paenibacillus lemnae]|uniref:LacI family transcriptional regulator n=1 Tax=Paenibacillus lemnae TaxID=1330551 RepID=A0A848M9M8_PAELE|nr:LacI family DNA-binding transcriptional regulator [Paenibacillus lemnae]NMO96603.1 LacI family transcriptional regulator [Paenibacillus lemnae]
MAGKVTMQQIADHLGVSKYAVSKALSGKPGVSPDTRTKIVNTATQLGYFTNKGAAGMSRKTDLTEGSAASPETVIVLVPKVRYQTRDSVYWGRIIDGITSELERRGTGMIIMTDQFKDSFASLINPGGVLGIIGVGFISSQLLLEIRTLGIPLVLIDHEDPLIPSDSLFMNNVECIRRVTNYLIGFGHRRLQFVGNIQFSKSFADRYHGYRSMLEEYGICSEQQEELLSLSGSNRSEMTESLEMILGGMKELPTAFVCANDSIAICVMTVLGRLQVAVPERCSVTGFDDIEDAALSTPALSTIHVFKEALGRRAVETLMRRAEQADSPHEKIMLAGDFIIRNSTAYAEKVE